MNNIAVKGVGIVGWIAFALAPQAAAQFHSKTPNGQAGVNRAAVNSAQRQAASGGTSAAMAGRSSSGATVSGGGIGGGDMILPEGVQQALGEHNVKLGMMQGKPVDIWGRAIHHGDESFTESRQDNTTNTLEQITKSKGGVELQRRLVSLDERGRPSEVMIYDGRKQFKYRGVLLYDTSGRFSEEQTYDAKGTLIRRKVQEYSARGEKLPLRSWDYVANVPEDLKLVITRDDGVSAPGAQRPSAPGAQRPSAPPAAASAAPASGKKGLNLPGIFGKKRKE